LFSWIDEHYEKTKSNQDFIKVYDMYDEFKQSDVYNNLEKNEKKMFNKKYFIGEIIQNGLINKYYRDRMKIDNKFYRNIITNYKAKEQEDKCLFDE
jgi:hypothetical protein